MFALKKGDKLIFMLAVFCLEILNGFNGWSFMKLPCYTLTDPSQEVLSVLYFGLLPRNLSLKRKQLRFGICVLWGFVQNCKQGLYLGLRYSNLMSPARHLLYGFVILHYLVTFTGFSLEYAAESRRSMARVILNLKIRITRAVPKLFNVWFQFWIP